MKQNKYQIAANVEFLKLNKYKGKLSAKVQRELFGYKPFGRKTVEINADNQGTVKIFEVVFFGQDMNIYELTFDEIAWECPCN